MSGNAWDYSYGGALDENHTVRDEIESTDQTSSPSVDISASPYVVNAFVEEAAFSGLENGSRDESLSYMESNMEQDSSIAGTQALRLYSHDPATSTFEPAVWDNSDVESETTTDDHVASGDPADQQEAVMNEDEEMQQPLDIVEEDDRRLFAAALYVERRRRNVRLQNFFGYFRRDRFFTLHDEREMLREVDDAHVPGLSVHQINDMNFDTSLPEKHQYLGEDLEVNSGRTVHLERDIVTLPFIAQSSIVLLPKQSIPMYFNRQRDVALFRSVLAGDKTFVFLSVLDSSPSLFRNSVRVYAGFGTVAEIVMSAEDDDQEVFKIVAEGRERCEVLEHLETTTPDGVIKSVKVRILPDNNLPYNMFHSLEESFLLQSSPSEKLRQLCHSTKIPVWVVCMYDVYRIMRQIRNVLSQLFMNESGMAKLSEDPSDFSFLVASFLPLSPRVKYKLLTCGCALQRLKLELQFLTNCQFLNCTVCKQKIASTSEIIVMSNTGALATFVNPGGIIYETLTLNKICGRVTCVGKPQTENSWFPGYAWTPASCSGCHSHLGWLFTRARTSSKTLKPERFWGISNSALCPEGDVEKLLLDMAMATA